MGAALAVCFPVDGKEEEQKNNNKDEQKYSVNESICNALEKEIQRDPGNRGIKNLHIPGQLYKACSSLIKAKNVVIMTGYVT